jgi:hypothetical protein
MALPPRSAEHYKTSIKDDGCPDEPSPSCCNGFEKAQQVPTRRICRHIPGHPQPLRGVRIYTMMLVTNRWHKQISAEENANDS